MLLIMNDTGNDKISKRQLVISLSLVFFTFACIFFYFKHKKNFPTTEDAYIKAYLINITPKINGTIKKVYVNNNQHVNAGELLLELDPVDYESLVQQAILDVLVAKKASVTSKQQMTNASANIRKSESNYRYSVQMAERYINLFKQKAGSQEAMQKFINDRNVAKQELDQSKVVAEQANIQFEISKAKVKLSKVQLKNAKLTNSYTKIHAPVSGYISDLNLQSGQVVGTGKRLFGLIDDKRWWVNANYKETKLMRMKPGQKVSVHVDMYDHKYRGYIESISHASGNTFSLLPAENATGNWVKVSQRFTVKVMIENDLEFPLRVGASATVTVDTRKSKNQ